MPEMEELPLKGGVQRAISQTGRRHFAQLGLALLSVCVVKSLVFTSIFSQPTDALLAPSSPAAAAHSQKLSLIGRGNGPRDGSTGYVNELPGPVFDAMDDTHAQARLPKVNLDSWSGFGTPHGGSTFKARVHQLRRAVHPPHDDRAVRVVQRAAVSEPLQRTSSTATAPSLSPKAEEDGPEGAAEEEANEGMLPPPGDDAPAEEATAVDGAKEDTAVDGVLARTSDERGNAAGSLADTANDEENAEGALATEDVPADSDPSGEKAEYPGVSDESWRTGGDDGSWSANRPKAFGGALSQVKGEGVAGPWSVAGKAFGGSLSQVKGEGGAGPWSVAGKVFGGSLSQVKSEGTGPWSFAGKVFSGSLAQVKSSGQNGALAYVKAENAGGTLAAAADVANNGGALAEVRGSMVGGSLAAMRAGGSGGALTRVGNAFAGGSLASLKSGHYMGDLADVSGSDASGSLLGHKFTPPHPAAPEAPGAIAEEVDGSLSVSSGKEMAGGALSGFGSSSEGEGWLATAARIIQPGMKEVTAVAKTVAKKATSVAEKSKTVTQKMLKEIRDEASALAGEEKAKLIKVRREEAAIKVADKRTTLNAAALEKDVEKTWNTVEKRIATQEATAKEESASAERKEAAAEKSEEAAVKATAVAAVEGRGARSKHAIHRLQGRGSCTSSSAPSSRRGWWRWGRTTRGRSRRWSWRCSWFEPYTRNPKPETRKPER
ncbi:hypothetical protein T484DRAFT_2020287 [Baffinella frigidus]|nr:hypothetical protein T484DRAFT_2020287 [Cryptophyta sp. CCMP2293]